LLGAYDSGRLMYTGRSAQDSLSRSLKLFIVNLSAQRIHHSSILQARWSDMVETQLVVEVAA